MRPAALHGRGVSGEVGQLGHWTRGVRLSAWSGNRFRGRCVYCRRLHRVQRFGQSGDFVAQWGDDSNTVSLPDVAIDAQDRVYVGFNSGTAACPRAIERRSLAGVLLGKECLPFSSGNTNVGVNLTGEVFVSDGSRVLRFDPSIPSAALAPQAGPTLTGAIVRLDASASAVPFASVADYEWDLDGDGSFERSTGTVGETSTSYATRGVRDVRVRVTAPSGKTAATSSSVDVRQAPPPGVVGVSINDGAQFTNDPRVTLRSVWPGLTTNLTVANDGGFAKPGISGGRKRPVDARLLRPGTPTEDRLPTLR